MKPVSKWFGIGGGLLSSTLGIIGTVLLCACPCKVVALSAIIAGLFGAGAAAYIKQYSWLLIMLGIALFAWGLRAIRSSRKTKSCNCRQSKAP